MTREETRQRLLECESRDLVRRYYPSDINALKAYLAGVVSIRGAKSAAQLRSMTRVEWNKRRDAENKLSE